MNHKSQKIISAGRIFTGEQWLNDHCLVVSDGIITDIIPRSDIPAESLTLDYPDDILCPAFIDIQLYGAAGRLLAVYPDTKTLEAIRDYSGAGGAWLSLPTIATNTRACMEKCIDAVRDYMATGGEGIAGIHLEGPWINPVKRGAHIEALIHQPSLKEVKEILDYGKDVIRMITLAPEQCSQEVVELIRSYGVICSAGHSNASYAEAMQAFDHGFTTVTHLYNAMSALQHRAPGMVGAVLDHPSVMASIIPDGHHVDYAAIRIAKKIMGERLFVITDAVTESHEGYYPHQPAGDKFESGGILSGSALTMLQAAHNLVEKAGLEWEEAIRMCSVYPARVLQMDHLYGRIAKGCLTKLLVLNKNYQLKDLIV